DSRAQHDDNGSAAVTDGVKPAHGQGDRSEPASPKFADVGGGHSVHATDEDPFVQSAPANNGHHWGADPEINVASNAKPDVSRAQHDDNGSPAVTDGVNPAHGQGDRSEPASPKFADVGGGHSVHATDEDTSVQS